MPPSVRRHQRALLTRLPAVLAAVTGLSLLTVGPAPAHARSATPDLVVSRVSVDKTAIAEGATVKVTHVVANRGSAKAAATQTRFYLSTDVAASLDERRASRTNPRSAPQDVLLVGAGAVKILAAGAHVSVTKVSLTVPVGTAAGGYTVLACADDRGAVKEKDEANNCTPAGDKLKVAPAPDSDTLRLASFADSYAWPEDEDHALQLIKIFCAATYPARKLTLKSALAGARDHLTRTAGADALTELDESGRADTPESAQELAATAVSQGAPGLALAALLRAQKLEPRNGGHLVNLASLATSIGLPNEALAFLDAAAGLDLRRPAMGVSQRAIALTVRGQALVLTGRSAAAETMFTAAKNAEPLLSEADAGLATIEACKDHDARAARFIRASRQRTQKKDTTPPTEEPVRPAPELDLGQSRTTPLRQLPMAETPAQGVAMKPVYDQIADGFFAEIDAHNAEDDQLSQHLRDTDNARTWAEKERRDSLLGLVYAAHAEPDIAALRDEMYDLIDKLLELKEGFFGGGTGEAAFTYDDLSDAAWDTCAASDDPDCHLKEMNRTCRPELTGAHTRWRGLMAQLQSAADAHFTALSRRMSGYASNLLDEEANRLGLLSIEQSEMAEYALIVQVAAEWTHYERLYEEECVAPLPAEVLNPPAAESAASGGACPSALKAINVVIALGPTKLKANCEKITQSISTGVLPLINAFAEVTYDFRSGTVTVLGGSKAEAGVGGVKGGFKSGVYVTVGQDGIKDVGWRVGPSVTATAGPVEVSAFKDEMDLSFVAGLNGS